MRSETREKISASLALESLSDLGGVPTTESGAVGGLALALEGVALYLPKSGWHEWDGARYVKDPPDTLGIFLVEEYAQGLRSLARWATETLDSEREALTEDEAREIEQEIRSAIGLSKRMMTAKGVFATARALKGALTNRA